jgi:CspA family cold shock protein
MVYRDTMVTCANCGKDFVDRIEDQRKRGDAVAPPERCPACRGETPQKTAPTAPAPRPTAEAKIETTVALGPGPHEGTVKWYDGEKGYGFVAHPDGAEIFFHRTGVAPGESPHFPDGTPVTFLIEQTEKGPQAVDVARMDEETEKEEE